MGRTSRCWQRTKSCFSTLRREGRSPLRLPIYRYAEGERPHQHLQQRRTNTGTIPSSSGYTNTVGDLAGIPLRAPEGGLARGTGWPPSRDLNRRLPRRPAVPEPDTPVWNESALPSTPPRVVETLSPARQTASRGRALSPSHPR